MYENVENLMGLNKDQVNSLFWSGKITFSLMTEYDRVKSNNNSGASLMDVFASMKHDQRKKKINTAI